MRNVFLDTVGLIATWDTRDQWHALAAPVFEQLIREGATLLTTEFVLAECGNAASRKLYRSRVGVLRDLLNSQRRITPVDEVLLNEAWNGYRTAGPAGPGLVDHISFIVMRRLGVQETFTNDHHFKAAGFITLF